MKIGRDIYFYEGDRVDNPRRNYFGHYQGMASSNFLVIAGESQCLVDSGIDRGPHRRRIEAQIADDGVDMGRTRVVAFSHAHPDHVLMAKRMSLSQELRFYLHEDNRDFMINEEYSFEAFFNYPKHIRREILVLPSWVIKRYLKAIGMSFGYIKAEAFFKDGDSLDFGTEMRAVPLSSHCRGHVGFYFPEEKILYSGDLFDHRCSDGASIVAADSSYERAFEDIDRILGLDVELLVPGHGTLIRGRDAIRERLLQVKAGTGSYATRILSSLPKEKESAIALPEITERAFEASNAYNAFSRRIISYHVLCHLQCRGLVASRMRLGRSFFYAV